MIITFLKTKNWDDYYNEKEKISEIPGYDAT